MITFDQVSAQAMTDFLKRAIDAHIAWQELPVTYLKTRNGWAGYKGDRRITKFRFSEAGARADVETWEASEVKTTVVDF